MHSSCLPTDGPVRSACLQIGRARKRVRRGYHSKLCFGCLRKLLWLAQAITRRNRDRHKMTEGETEMLDIGPKELRSRMAIALAVGCPRRRFSASLMARRDRYEERRVGEEVVSKVRSRGSDV